MSDRFMRGPGRLLMAGLVSGATWSGITGAPALVAQDHDPVQIEEWDVPWAGSRPRDPYVGPDGEVWFVGQTADYVARLDPATGSFERFELAPGTGPHNLIVDEDGFVWYAGNLTAHIGRLDPATGAIQSFPMPDSEARDPHTLVFDRQEGIWFTLQHANMVGHLDRRSGEVDIIRVPTPTSRPYGIVLDAAGRPWVCEFAGGKIATIDPRTMELREYGLPRADARPRRLQIASDGGVWYVDFAGGVLGRLDPASGGVEEYPMPGGAASRPYGMAVDDWDRIWFVETGPQPNRFLGFDTRSREYLGGADIPSGGGAVRHMFYDSARKAVWFGTDANTVGRARLP